MRGGGETFGTEIELNRLDKIVTKSDMKSHKYLMDFCSQYIPIKPERLINGNDLQKVGFKESPQLGKVLNLIYMYQLNNDIKDKKALINWAIKKHEINK